MKTDLSCVICNGTGVLKGYRCQILNNNKLLNMKTTEEIQDDIYNILDDCNQTNGQYAADSTDKAKAAALITEYIIHSILK